MGTNYFKYDSLTGETSRLGYVRPGDAGDAIVEATILFPIMTMIFAALVIIAAYLPAQAALQRATQYAATVLAAENSDTWLGFDVDDMSFYWETDPDRLPGIYTTLFNRSIGRIGEKGEQITINTEARSISSKAGELTVHCYLNNKIIYNEIIIIASREFPIAGRIADLSLIGFPETITLSATSVAVVQNGDEFIRNMDLATDFARFVIVKFGLDDMFSTIGDFGSRVKDIFGW